MQKQILEDYFRALKRLVKSESIVVPRGAKICNDSVSMEAGRGKGTIKKSRPIFSDLIVAIDEAARLQKFPEFAQKEKLEKVKSKAEQYQIELDAALARELCLLREIFELRIELSRLTGKNIVPILGGSGQSISSS
jgi:hypothetical protein